MKTVLLITFLFLCGQSIGQRFLSLDSIAISKVQIGLKVNTDTINSMRGQLKIIKAALSKQEVLLAKKDTVWFYGFGGYGIRTAPFNMNAVKYDVSILKKSIVDIKSALVIIRNDISASKTRLGTLEKNVSNLLAALAAIRKDIADIKAKLPQN